MNKKSFSGKRGFMKFKVVSSNDESQDSSSLEPKERITSMIGENPVFLFMKGTPEAPQCGCSNRVIQVLNSWNVPFKSFDVLSDEGIRQGSKDLSNWPTIPQLYVKQEFGGGCDIIEEISKSHSLIVTLEEHSIIGGLGSAVSEQLSTMNQKPPLLPIGIPDEYGKAGSYLSLLQKKLLLPDQIANTIANRYYSL